MMNGQRRPSIRGCLTAIRRHSSNSSIATHESCHILSESSSSILALLKTSKSVPMTCSQRFGWRLRAMTQLEGACGPGLPCAPSTSRWTGAGRFKDARPITMSSLESSESPGNHQGESYIADRSALRMTDTSMDRLLEQRERQDELRKALESLSEQDRLIVYMRYFLLAPTEEICARMRLSRHAIDTRLWRARRTLQNAIEDLRHERV